MENGYSFIAQVDSRVNLKRQHPQPVARFEPDGKIAVRVCTGVWTVPMSQLPIELFNCLPLWQQRQIIDGDFTLNRGFVQAKS